MSAPPKPFLKWVGGKRGLLAAIAPHLPKVYGTYHEPFVGGAAMFFHLQPKKAFLGDANERLVRTYKGVQRNVDEVIARLDGFAHSRAFYEKMRAEPIDEKTDVEVAAWFIYLNRTGFNGLYRVNSRNVFNVPFGDYAKPRVCRPENLRAAAALLARARIDREDFTAVAGRAKPGDFVYFDPPYVPLSPSASFTAYTKGGFGPDDHARLRDLTLELHERGVHVLVSNSSSPLVKELYDERRFVHVAIHARRMVSATTKSRAGVKELLLKPRTSEAVSAPKRRRTA